MGTVNVNVSTDTNTAITNNSSQAKASKLNSKDKTVKVDFNKLLAQKSSEESGNELSIQDCITALTTALTNIEANVSNEDNLNVENKEETALKPSTEKTTSGDKTKDFIALLSSLLNALTTSLQSKDLTLKVDNSSKADTTSITEATVDTAKVDLISKLKVQLETKVPEQGYQFKEIKQSNGETQRETPNLLELIKSSEGNDKIKVLKDFINGKVTTTDAKEVKQNAVATKITLPKVVEIPVDSVKNVDTTVNTIKTVKEVKNVIEELLSSVKAEGTNLTLKDGDIKRIEVVLKNLTQVVDNAEKQLSLKKTTENVQTLVKPQVLLANTLSNDTGNGNNRNEQSNSKANAAADKLLQKLAQKDNSDKTQSFANLVTRASNQNDLVPAKVTENLVINKENLPNDVIKTVKFMNTNEIKDLTVKIAPKDLGEVVIKLTQEGNVMKATITTSNKEAYQLINSNLQEINDKISNNNTSIQSFSVDVFNGDGSLFKQGAQQNKESNQGKKKNGSFFQEEDESPIESVGYNDSNVNILV